MIYILIGNDLKKKNIYIKEIIGDYDIIPLNFSSLDKPSILNFIGQDLFGKKKVIVLSDILSSGEIDFSVDELSGLKNSSNIFVFKEDKLLTSDQKKYKKYAEIESFETAKTQMPTKFNVFDITDAFGRHDKISTWVLYNQAISLGIEPESIAGVMFWKIKTLILKGSNSFSMRELKQQSSDIVSLYHKAHRGEVDFVIGLEQFILNSLSSK